MSKLKPGATYIYENTDGIVYAREFGTDPNSRFEIGRTLERQALDDSVKETELWHNIRQAAKSNPVLQDALDRVKVIYELSRNDGEK